MVKPQKTEETWTFEAPQDGFTEQDDQFLNSLFKDDEKIIN